MNSAQRRLVAKCVGVASFVAAVVVFEDWILDNWSWLQWAVLGLFPIVAALEGRPERPPDIEGWARRHPFIKWWLAGCTSVILAVAYAATHTSFRIDEAWILRACFLALGLMLGPFAVVGVVEKYRELDSGGDATRD